MSDRQLFRALTISASDTANGNGVQGDLAIFQSLRVHGVSGVTAVSAQNTLEVAAIAEVPDEVVIAQIDTVLHDIGANAVKTGMLSSAGIVQNVADRLEAWGIPHLVVDPVMVRHGVALLQPDAVQALRADLLPHATVVTPTLAEAEVLANRQIASPFHALEAAKAISAMGPATVVIKGGDSGPAGLLYHEGSVVELPQPLHGYSSVLGGGSAFSAAITALLARNIDVLEAISIAQSWLTVLAQNPVTLGEGEPMIDYLTPLSVDVESVLGLADVSR